MQRTVCHITGCHSVKRNAKIKPGFSLITKHSSFQHIKENILQFVLFKSLLLTVGEKKPDADTVHLQHDVPTLIKEMQK